MDEKYYCTIRCILTKFEGLGITTINEAIIQLDEIHEATKND